jgi:SAM-dependent methyltransferase
MEAAEPHDLEWTPDHVRRFWDYQGSNPALEDEYFSRRVGRSLVAYVRKRVRIGTAVDIGCGPGDLIRFLTERGIHAWGTDQSPASVEALNGRLGGNPHFKGAVVGTDALPDGIADTAFMVEVVEHLDDNALAAAMAAAHRLLKPGGHLVVTTPNDERLDASKLLCPECGAVFHRMQHIRSWSAGSLSAAVGKYGFERRSAEATTLSHHAGLLDLAARLKARLLGRTPPHLIYIGKRV